MARDRHASDPGPGPPDARRTSRRHECLRARQDRRVAQPHHQGPFGAGDRTRHEIRRGHRPQGHGAAPGPDPVRGDDGKGQERSEGHRSLPRALAHDPGKWRPVSGQDHAQGIRSRGMLAISDLHVAYGQSEVLHGLNVSVAPNEIVAIMGRNGMGKTTLMKSLMGILPTKSGSVSMDGAELSALPSYERVAKGLAYVPQGRMIFSTMTVKENIETGLVVSGGSEVPEDIYELFPVLLEMKGRRGGNLSGGQQQQLAIARALATKPKVLLLDEPTEGIQPSIIKEMARTLKRIRDERGLSIVVFEEVLSFALDIADRVLVIENGEIVRDDPRASVDAAQISKYLSV